MLKILTLYIILASGNSVCSGLKCHACNEPEIVGPRSWHDITGYKYGLCKHSEDLGQLTECPRDTTACGKITVRMDKAKATKLLEEVKHILPDARARMRMTIPQMKEMLLHRRGPRRRPDDEDGEFKDRLERNGMLEGYVRGCFHVFSKDRCTKEELFNIGEVCYCSTDSCNGAQPRFYFTKTIYIAAAAFFMNYLYNVIYFIPK